MVRNKAEFLDLQRAGVLGNYLRSWDTLEEMERSGYRGHLTIQSRVPGSPHFIPVTNGPVFARFFAEAMVGHGANPKDMYFRQIPDPDARRVIQFEAMLDEHHITMYYELDTTEPLRGIRERGRMVQGASAVAILQAYLSPSSYDDLAAMWEIHPTSIIEATEFSQPVGEYVRQLLFWEVRNF